MNDMEELEIIDQDIMEIQSKIVRIDSMNEERRLKQELSMLRKRKSKILRRN